MELPLDEFKSRQRELWAEGEYDELSTLIGEVGETVAARAGITPGMDVLDVACGTGNAARPAARAGGKVCGLDLTPKLLQQGAKKAEAEGLTIQWREGDAEALPFEDGSFDCVLSTFGHMFAPRHSIVAKEMMRVCRNGGKIVTATWRPEGSVGAIFEAAASYMPPLPDYASPPILWGREEYVRERFAGADRFEFDQEVNWIEWDSLDGWVDFFTQRFPIMVKARSVLGPRFDELRARVTEVWAKANQGTGGRLRLPQEYLIAVVRV